ncbi:carbohydrate ABC transporter permease [Streptomyces sp. PSKA54]|uniref:Carbohydrate ABC transporter permease n=1 Tax=Streptomyces himalayensis subsp. aureolus TaxID=2758039 RepID=A0A7W2D2Z3_9ACTN|nr:carbohydrate ABC transporter permease [Streptomyces himalayensis]MBA4863781.1 carbohydrate ABC transporter permease [Streptomyces himalayensis subsp. aureolus]
MSSEAIAAARRRSRKGVLNKTLLYGLMLALMVPFALPLLWMVSSSLKPISELFTYPPSLLPSDWRWENYARISDYQPFARQYVNSLYIAALVCAGSVVVSAMAGYAFARIHFVGRGFMFVLLLTALLMPSEVVIIPLFRLFSDIGWTDTHLPLILPAVFGGNAVFGTFIMRQFFLGLPAELEESGRLDGLGRFGLFFRIALPLAGPSLSAVGLLSFLHSWNSFLEPLVFLRTPEMFTLPLALTQIVDFQGAPIWNVQLAASTLTVLPVLAVFMVAQRWFIKSIVSSGLKG